MKKTLNSTDKIRLKSEFDYVRENGKVYVSKYCLVVIAESPDNCLRAGVICSKKYSKRAVKRNRARRLLWETFRELKQQIETKHIVFIARNNMKEKKQQDIQQVVEKILRKAKCLK